jgi:hypothetical protein
MSQAQAQLLRLVGIMTPVLGGADWGEATYGPSDNEARFAVLVLKGQSPDFSAAFADYRFHTLYGWFTTLRGTLGADAGSARAFTRDGVAYRCWPGSKGSLCTFQQDTLAGIGYAPGRDLDHLVQLTAEARRGVPG